MSPLLEFADPEVERAWQLHSSASTYPRIDALVLALNWTTNVALAWRFLFGLGAPLCAANQTRGLGMVGMDAVASLPHVVVAARAPGTYSRGRTAIVLGVRAAKALIAPLGFPNPCPHVFATNVWLYSPAAGNMLLAAMAVPLRYAAPLQLLAAARVLSGVPRACSCARSAGAEAQLCGWRSAIGGLHRRAGLGLLRGLATGGDSGGVSAAAAAGPCCAQVLCWLAACKTLLATLAVTAVIEAWGRAAWLAAGAPGAPDAALAAAGGSGSGSDRGSSGRGSGGSIGGGAAALRAASLRAARHQVFIGAAVALAVLATLPPVLWEATVGASHLARRAASGARAGELAVAALTLLTAVAVQLFMRLWLTMLLRSAAGDGPAAWRALRLRLQRWLRGRRRASREQPSPPCDDSVGRPLGEPSAAGARPADAGGSGSGANVVRRRVATGATAAAT